MRFNNVGVFYLPVAVPIPINDEPAFAIMARISAKSTLTKPGICNYKVTMYSKYQGSLVLVENIHDTNVHL